MYDSTSFIILEVLVSSAFILSFVSSRILAILDSSESRVILLSKSGNLVKQYYLNVQSSLLDFTVSRNGNTLYLLAGSRVFAIEIE